GVIDPRVGLVRDPFVGLALVLSLLTETGDALSDQVGKLPQYAIIKKKYELATGKLTKLYKKIATQWSETQLSWEDGLRLEWDKQWIHVRPSNTEPIVRVIVEGPTEQIANSTSQKVGKIVEEVGAKPKRRRRSDARKLR